MNIDELNCPLCKEQYTQANPPRLLTMCGHTFCHKCIKTLITKKKDKAFKIKCPIDKGSMEMQKPNPSLFPKNIALIDLLNKNNACFTSNQFLDISIIQKNLSSEKSTSLSQSLIQNNNPLQQSTAPSDKIICMQHNKLMDVYCVNDCQIICTDCALFSHHRSHQVKNLAQILNLESQKIKDLETLMKGVQDSQQKFMSKQIQDEIFELLDKKKKIIEGEISHFFAQIRQLIDQKENEMKEDLQAKGMMTAEKMRAKMKEEKEGITQNRVWEDEVTGIINHSQENTEGEVCKRLERLIKNGYYERTITQGRVIMDKMQKMQEQFISSFEQTLDCFTFSSYFSDVQLAISRSKVVCQIISNDNNALYQQSLKNSRSSSHSKFQNLNPLTHDRQNASEMYITSYSNILPYKAHPSQSKNKENNPCHQDDEEQSLLDFDMKFDPKPLRTNVFSCNNISVLSVNSSVNDTKGKKYITFKPNKGQQISRRLNTSQISSKSRTMSINGSTSSMKSISRLQKPEYIKSKKNESRFKYQSLIENISENKIDAVDLTGAEPKADELMMILEAIQKSQSVKSVKLMRNKLEDSFIEKYMKFLMSVERVNLAQNKFSQQGVDGVLNMLKEHPEHRIESLNMGQNRIVERKNRKVLDQFKKLNVNIVL